MVRFASSAIAFASIGVTLISGCSAKSEPAPVSRAELQKTLIDQLAQAGTPSTWVDCQKDLPGNVGAVTRCDVKFGADNAVTAVLTTTEVSGDKVTWEVTGPELTKDQVTKRVAGLTSAQSATCDSGLQGRTGSWVQCHITRNGVALGEAVEVKNVKGLSVDLTLTTAIPQQQLEDSVLARVTPTYGRQPDNAQCAGDLVAVVGNTMKCVVSLGNGTANWVVTVTRASADGTDFEVSRPPGKPQTALDRCHGCIG